jgi:hypothetical protein
LEHQEKSCIHLTLRFVQIAAYPQQGAEPWLSWTGRSGAHAISLQACAGLLIPKAPNARSRTLAETLWALCQIMA